MPEVIWQDCTTSLLLYCVLILTIYIKHFRHILCSLHYNGNVHRETETGQDGKPYYRVSYPKFEPGKEVVREVAVPPTYGECIIRLPNF